MTTRKAVLPSPVLFRQTLILSALLLGCSAAVFAQRVETQDAGGGRKIELHYNAAGKVVETRTLGPDGKLLEKDVVEYVPGGFVPQTLATSYWPNGQVHKVTHNTYDNNANFTGEFIQIFDENGKQIGGHRLTHGPQTNVYTCAKWDTAANAYKPEECPAGEEGSGLPETVKKFTADEVMQQLTRASAAASQPAKRTASPAISGTTATREVGLVLPSRIRPGERVSGRVVENPSDYENTPELMVTRFALPGNAGTLSGWQVEISGEPSQAADGPIALTVPPGQLGLAVLFRPTGTNAGAPVSRTIKIASAKGASQGKAAASYLAPPVCVKDEICIVRGAFNGNSSKTFAAFETRPAQIIAETSNALYLAIPEATEPGPRPLVIAEGAKAIAFPTVVAEFSIQPDRRSLHAGDQLLMYPTVEGPSDLPDPEWRTGNFPPSNLELARKLVPEFQPRGSAGAPEKHVAEERREKEKAGEKGEPEGSEAGEILLVVKNLTPDIATFRGSKDGIFVFHLDPAAFTMGDFKYKFVVEAKQTGNFAVQGWLIPFLAPVTGQEFPVTAAASK